MSPDTTLQALVERYLDERHRLGFSARTQAYALRSFARHVQAVGHHGPITLDVMASWARCDSRASSDPHTCARRQLPWPVDVNYPGRWKRGMRGSAFRL